MHTVVTQRGKCFAWQVFCETLPLQVNLPIRLVGESYCLLTASCVRIELAVSSLLSESTTDKACKIITVVKATWHSLYTTNPIKDLILASVLQSICALIRSLPAIIKLCEPEWFIHLCTYQWNSPPGIPGADVGERRGICCRNLPREMST